MTESFFGSLSNNSGFIILTISMIVLLLIAWNVYLQLQFKGIKKKQKDLFGGKTGQDLEQLVLGHSKDIKKLDEDIEDLYEISEKIHKISLKGIQKVGVVRFNPFKDTGGNQSFAVALLDSSNSGLIISSLFTREETRVYSKPIKDGASEFQLSKEEKEAVKKAVESN